MSDIVDMQKLLENAETEVAPEKLWKEKFKLRDINGAILKLQEAANKASCIPDDSGKASDVATQLLALSESTSPNYEVTELFLLFHGRLWLILATVYASP